ncbi:hypothetical protein GWK26_12790 [haloarchaeon 3A1-DGR]|nr:hypothetical protein GWK26_12790 [haloarchaeon 3A1-DGR]
MTEEATKEKYESELEELLPDNDDPLGTEEYSEIVDESEQVSSEVDTYIYKAESGPAKTKLTNHSDS